MIANYATDSKKRDSLHFSYAIELNNFESIGPNVDNVTSMITEKKD